MGLLYTQFTNKSLVEGDGKEEGGGEGEDQAGQREGTREEVRKAL